MSRILDQSFTTQDSDQYIGYDTTAVKVAQSFTSSVRARLSGITVRLGKLGSPTDNVILELYTDTSDAPGTLIQEAVNRIPAASLTGSYADYTFTFANNGPLLVSGTVYWLVLSRSGSVSSTDVPFTGYSDPGGYSGGHMEYFSSGVWTQYSSFNDLYFIEYYESSPAFPLTLGISV